jgi:hypothetical protein
VRAGTRAAPTGSGVFLRGCLRRRRCQPDIYRLRLIRTITNLYHTKTCSYFKLQTPHRLFPAQTYSKPHDHPII